MKATFRGMNAATENLVLEHLRHIGGAVDALREDMREVKGGLALLWPIMRPSPAGSIGSKDGSKG
jgi:hypothetical protein